MKNLNLKYKFAIGFGIVLLLFIASSVSVIYNLRDLVNDAKVNNDGNRLRDELKAVYIDHLEWSNEVMHTLTDKKNSRITVQTNDRLCNFGKWYYGDKRMEVEKKMPELSSLFDEIEIPHQQLHQSIHDLNEILQSNDSLKEEKIYNVYNTKTNKHLEEVKGLLIKLIERSHDITISDDHMIEQQVSLQTQTITITIIAFIISLVFVYFTSESIISSVNKGIRFAGELAKGNFVAKMDINQKDEIGKLANSLNKMSNRLKNALLEVKTISEVIENASNELATGSQNTSISANEQAGAVEEISSVVQQMLSNIQMNTDNARQTEKISEAAANDIESNSEIVTKTVDAMKTIADKITIINDIAFQTNILALNAAVEAARAGQHGKGFAVVASEVRKLAERSSVAATDIESLVKRSVDYAVKTGELFENTVPQIKNTAQLVKEIAAASGEQSSGVNQINDAVNQLNQISQRNAAASEEGASTSEQLQKQAQTLFDILNSFKFGN